MKKIILAMVAVMVPLMLSAGSTDFWFLSFFGRRWIILQRCTCYYAG